MQVTGIIRTGNALVHTDVERLTNREIFSLVRHAGGGAFAVTVNEASEIEVMINPDKLLVRRKGGWAVFDPDIIRSFLAGSIDASAVDDLLWTVYALSKSRHGTVEAPRCRPGPDRRRPPGCLGASARSKGWNQG